LITGLVSNCTYVGNLEDFEDNTYHPDPSNIMAYTPLDNTNKDCGKTFSPSQQTIILNSIMSSFSVDTGFPDKFERNDMLELATELRADGQQQVHSLINFKEGNCTNDEVDFIWVNRYGLATPTPGKQILGNLIIEIEAIDGEENPIGSIEFFEMSGSGSGATRGTTIQSTPLETLHITDKISLSCAYINPLTKNIGIEIKRHSEVAKGKYTIKAYLDSPQPYMNLTPSHIVCLGDEISIEGVPEGAKVEWKTSSYYDYIKLSDTRIKLTSFASINFSSVPVKALVKLGDCAIDVTENIKLGSYIPPTPLPPLDVKAEISGNGCTLKSVTFTIPNAKEYLGATIDWQMNCNVGCAPMVVEISPNKSSMTVYPNMNSSKAVVAIQGKLTIKADCGNHEESQNLFYHFLRPEDCIGKELIVNVHPNPANEVINVDIETPTLTTNGDPDPNATEPQLREIRIVSPLEGMRYYRQTTETNFTIELDNYNNGIYYVQVVSGEKTTQKLFVVQKE
jgi:Secretion system C-terminal sorting domain